MPAEIDYLPVAAAGGANVDTQMEFAGSGYQVDGFTTGLAKSSSANKVWRQCSMMTAALANVISVALGGANVIDDGNLAALITMLTEALQAFVTAGIAAIPASVYVLNAGALNLIGIRTYGVVYQNLSGRTLSVNVVGNGNLGGDGAYAVTGFVGTTAAVGPAYAATCVTQSTTSNGSGWPSIHFEVPPESYYTASNEPIFGGSASGGAPECWTELIN